MEIADFEVLGSKLTFKYKKGSEHKVADCLSRYPVDSLESSKEFEDKWVVASAMVDPPELSQMEEVASFEKTPPEVKAIRLVFEQK